LLIGFFIDVIRLNSSRQKGFPALHHFIISLESHGAPMFTVGDNGRHGLSPLGYDNLFLIVQGSLDQPAEPFSPFGYANSNFLHLISEIVAGPISKLVLWAGEEKMSAEAD
jgi:hypothetical protein